MQKLIERLLPIIVIASNTVVLHIFLHSIDISDSLFFKYLVFLTMSFNIAFWCYQLWGDSYERPL